MIDIGVNLAHSQLIQDVEGILERAKNAGINHCVITGTDLDSSRKASQLAEDWQDRFPTMLSFTAGVHPHDAKTWNDESAAQIRELSTHQCLVAIGEAGLDFNRNFSPKDQQIAAFEAQIELAAELGKPLFLHERDAFQTEIEILRSHRDSIQNAVIHCFTGDKQALFGYLDLDLHIGITGWVCDERRGLDLAKIVSNIPLNRLMVETDAPFLLPRNIDPKPESRTNEPCYLPWVIKKLAECYSTTKSIISQSTTDTAKQFFGLDRITN